MSLYETETMAELCIKQGHLGEGLEIYRRLVLHAPDELTRARRARRLAELETAAAAQGVPAAAGAAPAGRAAAPALEVRRIAEGMMLEWSLPAEIRAPALQLLLVRRTPAGIETEARTLRLETARGRTTLAARGLHSLRAAAGRLEGERFIPLVTAGVL
jgi:hypothetical protein